MKIINLSLILFVCLSLISISTASFTIIKDSFIETSYSGGDLIRGTFSMNFSNQPNAFFTSNLGGNISLLDFFINSSYTAGGDYNCVPSSCKQTYLTSNMDVVKSLDLDSKSLIGIAITNKGDVEITDLSFNVSSSAEPSCYNQFSIDLFDDGSLDIYNTKYLDQPCFSKNNGCFDSESSEIALVGLDTSPYCQKMTLPASPAYRIGANITNGTLKRDIVMDIYDYESGDKLGSCKLPGFNYSTQELDCIANYSAKSQFDSLVCISTEGIGFKINSESEEPICGFAGFDTSQEFQADYSIYAQPLKYAQFTASINTKYYKSLNDEDIYSALQGHIEEFYSNQCKPNCVIPIRFIGNSQIVNVTDIFLSYKYGGAPGGTSVSTIYDISPKDVIINSSVLDFKFENLGFRVPNSSGTKTLKIYFNNSLIISEPINVTTSFEFNIVPNVVIIAQPTKFIAISSDSQNITFSSWTFGDSSAKVEVSGNTATHAYSQEGNYTLTAEVTKGSLISKRSFNVYVGDPKESANITLRRYFARAANLSSQLTSYPEWVKKGIEENLNISQLNSTLNSLLSRFNSAANTSDYLQIVTALSSLSVPISIQTTDSGSSNAVVGAGSIDLDYLEQITNSSIEDREELKGYLINWMGINYNLPVVFDTISKVTDSGSSPILTKLILKIESKTDLKDARYLVISYPRSSITFKENYRQGSAGQGTYIPLDGGSKDIEFSIPREISVSSLAMYLIPDDISKFVVAVEPPKLYPWSKVILIIIIILIIFFILYGILQIWYKRHYESYLFKNHDDLYNMINFIYNSRVAKLSDIDIRSRLSKAGWTQEQITYSLRKIDGKRTGMFEIPVFNIFDNQKTKKEIEKRHSEGIDARFIKRA